MTRYSSLLGQHVEARYRTGDIYLTVSGTLVSDSGHAISIEETFSLDGRDKAMRVEIPYDYVIRVLKISAKPRPPPHSPSPPRSSRAPQNTGRPPYEKRSVTSGNKSAVSDCLPFRLFCASSAPLR